jgi:hypothetical protein
MLLDVKYDKIVNNKNTNIGRSLVATKYYDE